MQAVKDMSAEKGVKAQRGELRPYEWATIYSGTAPMVLTIEHVNGGCFDVEVDGTIRERLEKHNPKIIVAGSKIRLNNPFSNPPAFYRFY